jgi:hypothetical protein
MSGDPKQQPEPFLSDFSYSVATCFVLVTILGISANFILAPEGNPTLSNAIGICVWGVSLAYSVWQYRRNRDRREAGGSPISENRISD